jgi:hypothetical protein
MARKEQQVAKEQLVPPETQATLELRAPPVFKEPAELTVQMVARVLPVYKAPQVLLVVLDLKEPRVLKDLPERPVIQVLRVRPVLKAQQVQLETRVPREQQGYKV